MTEECVTCTTWGERVTAALCLVVGVGIVFVAADILAGGWFTRNLTGRKLATVLQFPGADDGAA